MCVSYSASLMTLATFLEGAYTIYRDELEVKKQG